MNNPRPNPYIGPRAFRTDEVLYGRDQEINDLFDLLIAERIVVLHSPSGAGKSSLVSAGMVPRLIEEGFHVLPVVRVSQERPIELLKGNDTTGLLRQFNRYTFSSLLSLEEDLPLEKRTDLVHLARAHLDAYIDSIVLKKQSAQEGDKTSHVIIFDQFEETLTIDPNDREVKLAFFQQLGAALRNRNLWALIAIREDYLPGLEPYTRSIPTRLANTYRLDLLSAEAAHQAIEQPAQCAGVSFASEAASKLVDDLRHIQVQQADGSMQEQLGLYVEPVQLQVVCYRLWQDLAPDDVVIDANDLAMIGDVNQSLAEYYANGVTEVASETGVSEKAIRLWFDQELITQSGIRSQVLKQPNQSGGLENDAIDQLVRTHLIRAENRRNATWYELAHDRLIRPVRQNNIAWFEAHLSLMQRQATLWEEKGHPDGLLLRGEALDEAEKWTSEQVGIPVKKLTEYLSSEPQVALESSKNPPLTAIEAEFLRASLNARKERRHEQERVRNRVINILGVAAILLAILSLFFGFQSNTNLRLAKSSAAEAQSASTETFLQKATAEIASTQAVVNQHKAETNAVEMQKQRDIVTMQKGMAEANSRLANSRLLVALSKSLLSTRLDTSLLLGLEAFKIEDNPETRNNLSQQYLKLRNLIRYLNGSKGDVTALAFSPDGRTLASGGCQDYGYLKSSCSKGEILLWNIDTGQPTPFENDSNLGSIKSMAFSRDAKMLITLSENGQGAIWDVLKGQLLPEEGERKSFFHNITMNADGTLIAVYDADTIKVFSLDDLNGKSISARGAPIYSLLSLSPDGKWIIYNDFYNEKTFLWNLSEVTKQAIELNPQPVFAAPLAFSSDNRWLAWSDTDNQIIRMDLRDPKGKVAKLIGHTDQITNIAFNPDNNTLVTGSKDGTVRVWKLGDLNSTSWISINSIYPYGITQIILSPDGKTLVVGSEDGRVLLWDSTTLQPNSPPLIGHADTVSSLAFSQDGKMLASGGCRLIFHQSSGTICLSGEILLSEPSSGALKPIPLTGHEEWVNNAIFSPDGKTLYTGSDDGHVFKWDITNPEAGSHVSIFNDSANDIRLIPDHKTLAIADSYSSILFWDIEHQQMVEGKRYESLGGTFFSLAVSKDNESLAAGDNNGYIYVLKSVDLSPLHEPLAIYKTPVLSLDFSPDGRYLASGGIDGRINLLDLKTWQSRSFPVLIQGPVPQVAFSPDGRSLASAHNEGTAILWKLADDPIADAPEILGQLKGFNANLNTVAYDRTGKVLVTGDESGELIFWDLTTFKPARPAIDSDSGAIYRANFSPDGNLLVSTHKSGAVNLWPIDTGEAEISSWEAYICGIVNRNLTQDEFILYFPGETYRKICPSLP